MTPALLQLQLIDESNRQDHYYLDTSDNCYFCGEYTPKSGFSGGEMNSLILNFKKTMNKRESPEWQHKQKAIKKISKILVSLKAWKQIKDYTWVPVPSSKHKTDSLFDDRLVQTLQQIKDSDYRQLDFQEIVSIKKSRDAAHQSSRLCPDEHYKNFEINSSFSSPPTHIVIFDDVITTGSGFKAMKRILNKSYPSAVIIGIFIARTIREIDPNELFGIRPRLG